MEAQVEEDLKIPKQIKLTELVTESREPSTSLRFQLNSLLRSVDARSATRLLSTDQRSTRFFVCPNDLANITPVSTLRIQPTKAEYPQIAQA
jgi:hypothetical protein